MTQAGVREMQGQEPKNAGSLQKLQKARNGFFPRVTRRNIELPAHFRFLTSSQNYKILCVVLSPPSYGNVTTTKGNTPLNLRRGTTQTPVAHVCPSIIYCYQIVSNSFVHVFTCLFSTSPD